MSTTIAHPRSVPSGPSGRFVAGFVAAAIAVLGVGFAIVNSGEPVPVNVSPSTARGADAVILQRAAELAAEQAAVQAETERMLAINELGYPQSTARGADQLITQKAAAYAALQAALAETERMLAINELWDEPSTSAGSDRLITQKAADFLSQREETLAEATKGVVLGESFGAGETQSAQHESRIEFLTEQWKAQHGSRLNGAGPKSPIVVE
jgi:hypothetical protein